MGTPADDDEVAISDAARIAGVSESTLRRYEDPDLHDPPLIQPVRRLPGRGDRRYLVRDARKLRERMEEEARRKAAG